MKNKIKSDTKNYLVYMIENKIQTNPQDSVFENKRIYEAWYNPMDWYRSAAEAAGEVKKAVVGKSEEEQEEDRKKFKKDMEPFGGGFGGGKPNVKKGDESPSVTKTLFGDESEMSETEKEAEEEQTNPLLKALGIGSMAALGGAAAMGANALGGYLKGTGKFGKYLGQAVASLGKQAEEISGKTWIEAQLGKIGQSQLELAAQGAGSPWTKFVIPEKKPAKLVSPQERAKAEQAAKDKDLSDAIKRQEMINKAKKLGLTP